MVDQLQPGTSATFELIAIAGQETPPVLRPLDEGVDRVPESPHRGQPHRPPLVLQDVGLRDRSGPAADRVLEGGEGIVHGEG